MRGCFTTTDGVELVFDDTGGDGVPLVMLHGWGQTRAMFTHQLAGFRTDRRVIALDLRGHGESAKPAHGYRIARFAADLRDLLDYLDIAETDLLGWSMGASVIWSYFDLFGTRSIRSLIIVDQPAAVAAVPWMSEAEQIDSGAILGVGALVDLAQNVHNDSDGEVTRAFVRSMFSGEPDPVVWDFVAREIRNTPPTVASRLLFDHGAQNWLDVLPRIDVPTLVLSCDGSHVTPSSQRYLASLIPGAQVHVFPVDIANSHFPFLENPRAFNAVVSAFLSAPATHGSARRSSDSTIEASGVNAVS
jgi:pimeloyl-ACP methyl ester carboxylesterase